MKTYIIKDKIINIKTGEMLIYYLGKDGYVQDDIHYAEGYVFKLNAIKRIERDMDGIITKKLDTNLGIETDTWLHIYSIMEVGD